jgi:phage shock protein PspC (stress-responsive transcriptional regulator)
MNDERSNEGPEGGATDTPPEGDAPQREGPEPEPNPKDGETAPTEALEQSSGPRRFTRSRSDRMVAGVAGGLGRYFSVDPVIIRIGFAVSVFFGGLGALAYLALALFVPADPADGEEAVAPVQRSRWLGIAAAIAVVVIAFSAAGSLFFWDGGWLGWDGPWGLLVLVALGAVAYAILRDREPGQPLGPGRIAGAIALAIAGAIGLSMLAAIGAFAGATGGGVVIALVVIAIGAMLAIAAFRGGARWLIAPALALAIPLGAVSAADISFAGSIGEREYQPNARAEIADRYELGIGRLAIDLRGIDWDRQRDPVPLEADLGVGELVVIVPEEVCVTPDLHVGAGEIETGSRRLDGVDLDEDGVSTAVAGPSIELDAEVDVGSLRVLNEWDPDDHFRGPFGDLHDDRGSEDRAAVC